MKFSDLLDTVKDVAPALVTAAGTAVAGPTAGGVLGSLARKITGAGDNVHPDDIAAQILGDPDKLQQFRLESRKLELEELKVRTLDVQDARKTLNVSKGAVVVSILVTISFITSVILVMTVEIPAGSQNVAYLLVGTLGAGFTQVLNFWLGSSHGSKDKDATMAAYLKAAQADQAARAKPSSQA